MEKHKFGVIGVGPSGGILAAHLALSGEDVAVADIRREQIEAIRKRGLRITGMADLVAELPHAHTSISRLADHEIDVLFVATKTFSLAPVLREISGIYRVGMKIVCYQNGIDNEDLVAERFGPGAALRVVINYAGNITGDGEIKMTFFHKPNYVGAVSEESVTTAEEIAETMSAAGLETEYTPEIKRHEWQKTIFNAALAPVTALTGQTMRESMEQPETRKLVESLLREAISAAEARGIDLGNNFFEKGIRYLKAAGNHKPSMRIDIEEGRRTEIDFITGKIIEHAERLNSGCPVNLAVFNLIKGLEAKH